jgi:hypothetical protein
MPTATRGTTAIDVAAPPSVVYDLVTDVPAIGKRSPECYRAEWLDGATCPAPGARFRGSNKIGPIRWTTTCTVTTAEPGREFAFNVIGGNGRVQTQWQYRIEPTDTGCRLTESYQFVWCPLVARAAELPFPRDRQLRRGIRRTVEAIKTEAELVASS